MVVVPSAVFGIDVCFCTARAFVVETMRTSSGVCDQKRAISTLMTKPMSTHDEGRIGVVDELLYSKTRTMKRKGNILRRADESQSKGAGGIKYCQN